MCTAAWKKSIWQSYTLYDSKYIGPWSASSHRLQGGLSLKTLTSGSAPHYRCSWPPLTLNTQTLFDQLSNITQTQCLCINEKKNYKPLLWGHPESPKYLYLFSKNMSVNCFQGNLIYYINNHPWIPLLYKSKLCNFIWKPPKVKERTQKLTTLTQRMNSREKVLTYRI